MENTCAFWFRLKVPLERDFSASYTYMYAFHNNIKSSCVWNVVAIKSGENKSEKDLDDTWHLKFKTTKYGIRINFNE